MKKIISAIILLIIFCLGVVGFAGCQRTEDDLPRKRLPEYESGYFRYAVDTLPSGKQKAYLIGLTESGMQQTELIYPDTIDGYAVYGIGYEFDTGFFQISVGEIYSDNLQKFFMPTEPIEMGRVLGTVGSIEDDIRIVYWGNSFGNRSLLDASNPIYGYNLYDEKYEFLIQINLKFSIANVSYMYNYDNAPNDGYYWVDSYDESIITFIPPEPTRDGYTFGGWYKDSECTDIWNFDTDITGKEILVDRSEAFNYEAFIEHYVKIDYSGISLYAKWIEV